MSNSTVDPGITSPRQLPLRIDESRMTSTYANAIRTTTTPDEIVLDFGMNLPRQLEGGKTGQTFTIDSRVALNWANAKRLAMSLGQMVQAYEAQNGEVALAASAPGKSNR